MLLFNGYVCPTWQLKLIRKKANQLYSLLIIFADRLVGDDEYDKICRRVASALRCQRETVAMSLLGLRGKTCSRGQLQHLCWQLAASQKRLRSKLPLLPTRAITEPCWAYCQVVDCVEISPRRVELVYYILTGPAAGGHGVQRMTIPQFNSFRWRVVRRYASLKRLRPRDMQGMLFAAFLINEGGEVRVAWKSISATPSMLKFNRRLMNTLLEARQQGATVRLKNVFFMPVLVESEVTCDLIIEGTA